MQSLLKFITCGSVDDGKSTLIGHLLYDSKLLYTDQEEALKLDSKVGSREGKIDYSLLLDGLMAEREQGITIDVAYRYFTTDNRSFIVADTPGHEEYTRNMAVGASFADLAVILIDASQGVLIQTKRHARICSLMGIEYFVFALNKMDLVDYSHERYLEIEKQIQELSNELNLKNSIIIPVSATEGDNITTQSENTSWYSGPTLLNYLETVDVDEVKESGFYMPVQRVCRPSHEFRGFQGQIESGSIKVGDSITSLPSKEEVHVKTILVGDKNVEEAFKGQPVTIQLDKEVDVSRGCVLEKESDVSIANSIEAQILWMDDKVLETGKNFLVKIGTKQIPGIVTNIQYSIDVNTGERKRVNVLHKNEIAVCDISFTEGIVIDTFQKHRTLGELILIDRITNMTSACGVVENVVQSFDFFSGEVDQQMRSRLLAQKAQTFIFDSNYSLEFVKNVEKKLIERGRHTYLYEPNTEDSYVSTVKHLNQAGIVVLLSLQKNVHQEVALQNYKFVSQSDINEVVSLIVKETQSVNDATSEYVI